jgi:hypothetical protein
MTASAATPATARLAIATPPTTPWYPPPPLHSSFFNLFFVFVNNGLTPVVVVVVLQIVIFQLAFPGVIVGTIVWLCLLVCVISYCCWKCRCPPMPEQKYQFLFGPWIEKGMYKLRLPRALVALLSILTMYASTPAAFVLLSFFLSVCRSLSLRSLVFNSPSSQPQPVLRRHRPDRHQRQERHLRLH